MPDRPDTSSLRMLAPLALVLVAIAFVAVLLGSTGGGGSSGEDSTAQAPKPAKKATKPRPKPKPKVYVVKPSDTLALISEKTKVPSAKLQEINPGLDPQALVPGQKIKLQE